MASPVADTRQLGAVDGELDRIVHDDRIVDVLAGGRGTVGRHEDGRGVVISDVDVVGLVVAFQLGIGVLSAAALESAVLV